MRRIDRVLLAAAALLGGSPALACNVSVTPVSFGTYDTLSPADDDSTGTFSADCDASVRSIVVSISAGSSGSILVRTLRNGPTTLNYNLYTAPGRTILWGDGVVGSSLTLNPTNTSGGRRRYNVTIYGRIPALQPVSAGTYTDTVIITVTY